MSEMLAPWRTAEKLAPWPATASETATGDITCAQPATCMQRGAFRKLEPENG
eukprot:CAMPEP_0171099440 /NCGR_PEP_ID=MMETSP0766_2-20121228/51498_1 /TAXON_ID=439317 /ORGANISM="Gambierdiscus australes, Strain CAWD 149" /LENGTH=51 /DNA_ID=CAMNT_0011559061 /DNA_START=201 /DNA_END=353 /DNA_ORIENTATION=+